MKLTSKITKSALVVIFALSTLIAACSPEKIVTTNTQLEQQAQQYITQTCRKDVNGYCKNMGQP